MARDRGAALTVYDFAAAPGETVLKGVSTDNHFFAVRAVGKKWRSLDCRAHRNGTPPAATTDTEQTVIESS